MRDPNEINGTPRPIGRASHHIIVNRERLVLRRGPLAGERPDLDEDGAGAQCEGCGRDIFEVLTWDSEREVFVCDCGAKYGLRRGGYLSLRPRDDEEGDQ